MGQVRQQEAIEAMGAGLERLCAHMGLAEKKAGGEDHEKAGWGGLWA